MANKETLTSTYKKKDDTVKLFFTEDGTFELTVTPFPFLKKINVIHDREGLFDWFAGELKAQKAEGNTTMPTAEVARFISYMFNVKSKKSSEKVINFKRCLEILNEKLEE